jgi:hypothetical protein
MTVAGEHSEHGVARTPHQGVVLGDDRDFQRSSAEQTDVLKRARDAERADRTVHLLQEPVLAIGVKVSWPTVGL